jgi:NAD(P)-dependent dehydrogenase (short-subunit alcohol dehydrogenase family)
MSIANQTIVVTGASGHLGSAVAASLRAAGAHLILIDLQVQRLQAIFADDPAVYLIEVDLLNRAAVMSTVREACNRFGGIDGVCHIAGGFRMGEAVHDTTAETWDFLMDLNVRTLLNLSAATVPVLLQRGAGRFVTVGAGAAQRGLAYLGAYSASKSALIRLTESMSAELKGHNINVNCVLPSIIDTPDNRAAMPDADHSSWVTPAALADVITFLTSDAARAVHGAAIPVLGKV